ncbi:hypothetical protein M422DRAFT_265484 [Sphaerobolus stellatus SS14]|uniref:Uncharacterized protein n=1 Tax=Sphaerobolus stellatus (strain SS14) TaxID=990650 RepID=A0A0C9V5F0_SPHS4|nr:hypothetical protein M422DRAFT_265484 [Sphaerobolus stellatus SS14]
MSTTETEVKKDPPPPPSKEDAYFDPSFIIGFSGSPVGEINESIPEVSDVSFLWSSVLGPRILLENTPLGFRRNVMLTEGLKKLPWSRRLPYYPLPKHGERLADRLLKIVEGMLIGIPPRQNTGEPCYYMYPESWTDYLQEMKRILSASFPLLLEKDETVPSMPRWGPNNNPREAWIRSDFEIIGVMFHEDIENILGYLFDKEVLGLIPRGLDRVTFAPHKTSTPQVIIHQTPHHMSIHPTPLPTDRVYSTRGLIHQHMAQNTGIGSNRVIMEGLGDIRKRQSESIYAPRQSVIPPVYGKHPMDLAQSNKIKELFSPFKGPKRSILQGVEPQTPTPGLQATEGRKSWGIFSNPRKGEPSENSENSNIEFGNPGSPGGGPSDDPPPGGGPPGGGGGGSASGSMNPGHRRTQNDKIEAHFDVKLKSDTIPTWNGNEDTLAKWILKVNHLAERSRQVYDQLGALVPTRLLKDADAWFWSLPMEYQNQAMTDWGTLRSIICSYYMNRFWFDRQKGRANKAHYREPGFAFETPFNYYIHKSEMIRMVYILTDSEIMMEVMDSAPSSWNTIIDPH